MCISRSLSDLDGGRPSGAHADAERVPDEEDASGQHLMCLIVIVAMFLYAAGLVLLVCLCYNVVLFVLGRRLISDRASRVALLV